ncbi:hypothetical protein HNP12_003772 [Aeromonas hydrophila]|nr:hypothetical protein [Aeromonas hydrophila]
MVNYRSRAVSNSKVGPSALPIRIKTSKYHPNHPNQSKAPNHKETNHND